jgi:hypothetical protein
MPGHRITPNATINRATRRPHAAPFDWVMITALLAAVIFLLAAVLPTPLVLLALSVLFVGIGFGTAAALYLAGYRMERDPHRGWEIAAVLLFLGFAAAMLADTREVLAVLDLPQSGPVMGSSK